MENLREPLIILLITAAILAAVSYLVWRAYLVGYAIGYNACYEDPHDEVEKTIRLLRREA